MKLTPTLILGFIALSLIPSSSAAFTDSREYQRWIFQTNDSDGIVAQTNVVVPANPHGFTVTSRESVWDISATYQFFSTAIQTQTVVYQLEIDGTDVSGCEWRVSTIAVTFDARLYNHFRVRCMNATAVNPGTHSLEIKGAVTNANPVTFSRIDVILRQADTVTDATHDGLETKANSVFEHDQTRDLVNASTDGIHDHLVLKNEHLASVEANLTQLIMDFGCGESENCTFDVEPFSVVELPGYSSEQVGALLVFLTFLVISYFQRWLFVALASIIGILDIVVVGGVFGFTFTVLLLVLGLGLEVFRDIRDSRRDQTDEGSGSG